MLSQEVSLLQAINSKDKTKIPGYLQYRDGGFPDAKFLPFLRNVDTVVKELVNANGLKQEGENLIKVCKPSTYVYISLAISLSTIVLNSRDRQGMYGMQHFRTPRNTPYNRL